MPNPDYMESQNEITWEMRQTLVDWLLQAHLRYHMIPETIWIAINIVDRFLSKRVVSLAKLQLVGIASLFIAAKYEEIMAPSVDEFVAMAENGFTREEVLKGERIILQSLGFHISHYCSPYSWMRKISRADDYDLQTRTLCKFLTEVTLLDHRFLRAKPSLVAAVGMYSSRIMLGGDWVSNLIPPPSQYLMALLSLERSVRVPLRIYRGTARTRARLACGEARRDKFPSAISCQEIRQQEVLESVHVCYQVGSGYHRRHRLLGGHHAQG